MKFSIHQPGMKERSGKMINGKNRNSPTLCINYYSLRILVNPKDSRN